RRRPSGWMRAVWLVYAAVAVGMSLVVPFVNRGVWIGLDICGPVNAIICTLGLLLVSVNSVTSLHEERSRGCMEVLLTTPLSVRAIVGGQWWGTFRIVPLLTLLPVATIVLLRLTRERPWEAWTPVLLYMLPDVLLLVGMILAYGAALASLGLALATWVSR